jgi:hypothetical protein
LPASSPVSESSPLPPMTFWIEISVSLPISTPVAVPAGRLTVTVCVALA